MVEDLFEKELQERKIFKNVSILSPHYVPVELPHRENEIRDLTRIIAHVLRNEKPDNIFVYGKTGTGKTVSVKYVLRKLEEFVQKPEKNSNNVIVGVVYMNCKVRNSKYQVFLKILEDEALNTEGLKSIPLSDRSDKGLKGMDPADLYERLLKVIQDNGLNIVVILDEIDMITNGLNDVVYLLTRINDEIKSGSLSIIGISNDARFKKRLDPRTKSTLCEEERLFKPYNAMQLKSILKQRVAAGFQKKTMDDSAISRISAFAAQDGDARYALKLLQKAGEIAQDSGREKVTADDVGKAKNAVETDIMAEAISTLPEHQQIVMYSIAALALQGGMYKRLSGIHNGDLFSGEVYEAYEGNCNSLERSPRTMRQFSDYLNELEMLGMITLRASGKGVRGTTRLIRLGYPPNEIKTIVRDSIGLGSKTS
ncbi:MAG: AAA family ATPase [Candidatus Altiarchaeota archaeon]|nr:AAA family ATPase [Candidatus Altiarchaeota archaeon]